MPGALRNLTEADAALVVEEHEKRKAARSVRDVEESPILAELFPQQRAFALDPAREISALCNRRAGKTYAVSDLLLWTADQAPENDCLYLNLTGKLAKSVMWDGQDGLKKADGRHELGVRWQNQALVATMPNGARILCAGAENSDDIELYRGHKYKLVVIDEAGSFKAHLEPLITSVLQPTTVDLQGRLALVGTPGKVLAGLFYDATRSDGRRNTAWAMHQWSILDNPHIPHAAEEIARILRVNRWDEQNPTFQREWLGRWVRESSTLVYKFPEGDRAYYTELPKAHEWFHILGIDLGWSAPSVFRVISYSPEHPSVYLGKRILRKRLSVTGIATVIKELQQEFDFVAIVADTGALGVMIIEELNERHSLAVRPAQKVNKRDFIEAMNDDLRMERIKVPKGDPIVDEWANLQWEDDTRTVEDPRLSNHDSDASLYGWRESKHFHFVDEIPDPKFGQPGWHDFEAKRMEEADCDRFGGDNEQPWWEYQ